MTSDNSQARATAKWRAKTLDSMIVQPRKDEGQRIRAAAAAAGQSLNRYILDAVRARMATEHPPDAPAAPDHQSTD